MVEPGRVVAVHFIGRVVDEDGENPIFDTTDAEIARREGIHDGSFDYEPLRFEVGGGDVIEGIDRAVRDMETGDRTTIRIEPADAFGERDDDQVVELPRDSFDGGATEGSLVKAETGDLGWIVGADDERVRVDFNHELAGETLEFELWVVDVHDLDGE